MKCAHFALRPLHARRVGAVRRVSLTPELDAVVIKLLRPEQTGQRLTLDRPLVGTEAGAMHGLVERVGLLLAEVEDRVETARSASSDLAVHQPGPDHERLTRPDDRLVVGRGLGPTRSGFTRSVLPPTTAS